MALAEKSAAVSAAASQRDSRRSENSIHTNFSLFDMDQSIKIRTYWMNMLGLTMITASLQIMWQTARVWGSTSTIQSHAFALTNLHGIFLVPVMYYL